MIQDHLVQVDDIEELWTKLVKNGDLDLFHVFDFDFMPMRTYLIGGQI